MDGWSIRILCIRLGQPQSHMHACPHAHLLIHVHCPCMYVLTCSFLTPILSSCMLRDCPSTVLGIVECNHTSTIFHPGGGGGEPESVTLSKKIGIHINVSTESDMNFLLVDFCTFFNLQESDESLSARIAEVSPQV